MWALFSFVFTHAVLRQNFSTERTFLILEKNSENENNLQNVVKSGSFLQESSKAQKRENERK